MILRQRLFVIAALGTLGLGRLASAQPGVDDPLSPYDDVEPTNETAAAGAELAPTPVAEDPGPPKRATLRHVPPSQADEGQDLRLLAVIDDAWVEDGLAAYYRVAGETRFEPAEFERSTAGGFYATIPSGAVTRKGVEYFIAGRTQKNLHFGSSEDPFWVRVEPPASARWIEAEEKRLGGRRYELRSRLGWQNFGKTHGSDRFADGSLDFRYRLVGGLYSIHLGFAFLEGQTPSGTEDDAMSLDRGVRYGYGGMRFRLADKVWVDSKAMMGFGKEGFVAGLGGALTLGNDWRTAVTVGAEGMSELSYKAWITLQWDTVPPFLMSATAGTTNMPDAQIDAGSWVEYKIRYPVTEALEVGAAAQFSARGNRPGGLGAALETRVQF